MRKSCGTLLLAVGILLLAAALLLISYNTAEESRAEAAVEAVMPALSAAIAAQAAADVPPALDAVAEPPASDAQPSPAAEPVVQIDGEAFLGYLTIDALALSLPVRQTLTEPNLKASPCRYAGSVDARGFVIAAHNYRRQFAGLGTLAVGDAVRFTDAAGRVHTYAVSQVETLDAADVTGMTDANWDLTLFTCTYSGERRVTVRCTKAEAE